MFQRLLQGRFLTAQQWVAVDVTSWRRPPGYSAPWVVARCSPDLWRHGTGRVWVRLGLGLRFGSNGSDPTRVHRRRLLTCEKARGRMAHRVFAYSGRESRSFCAWKDSQCKASKVWIAVTAHPFFVQQRTPGALSDHPHEPIQCDGTTCVRILLHDLPCDIPDLCGHQIIVFAVLAVFLTHSLRDNNKPEYCSMSGRPLTWPSWSAPRWRRNPAYFLAHIRRRALASA
jgi:hypothetical protein